MSHTKQENGQNIQQNIASHTGVNKANPDELNSFFSHTPSAEREKFVLDFLSYQGITASGIQTHQDYEAKKDKWPDQQGLYLVTIDENRKFILHVRKYQGEQHARLSERIFDHIHEETKDTGYLRLARIIPLAEGNLVESYNGYNLSLTTYEEGKHLTSTPDEQQVATIARGLASMRNALNTLPEALQTQVQTNTKSLHDGCTAGYNFFEQNIGEARSRVHDGLGADNFVLLWQLAGVYLNEQEKATCHHGNAIDANMLLNGDTLIMLDSENAAMAWEHKLHDEGLAFFRTILDSRTDSAANQDSHLMETFVQAYNTVAKDKITTKQLAHASMLATMKNVLTVMSYTKNAYDGQKSAYDFDGWINGFINRYGKMAIEANQRLQAALRYQQAPASKWNYEPDV